MKRREKVWSLGVSRDRTLAVYVSPDEDTIYVDGLDWQHPESWLSVYQAEQLRKALKKAIKRTEAGIKAKFDD